MCVLNSLEINEKYIVPEENVFKIEIENMEIDIDDMDLIGIGNKIIFYVENVEKSGNVTNVISNDLRTQYEIVDEEGNTYIIDEIDVFTFES